MKEKNVCLVFHRVMYLVSVFKFRKPCYLPINHNSSAVLTVPYSFAFR